MTANIIDRSIYLNFATRCADGGWLRTPPQYRSDAECLAEWALDTQRDVEATQNWFGYRRHFRMTPAQIVAAQTTES